MASSVWKSSTGAWTEPTAATLWSLVSKPNAAARAGGVEAAMAVDTASAMVKVARRISSSSSGSSIVRNINRSNSSTSRGANKSSTRSSSSIISSINRGTSDSSPHRIRNISSNINRGFSDSSPCSTQRDGVYYAFGSGVVSTGIFGPSTAQYTLHH